jgi:hypothetical protein
MQSASYYRKQAAVARRVLGSVSQDDVQKILERLAQDYDDIATDLEAGAIDIVHPELMPQLEHPEVPTVLHSARHGRR